LAVIGSLYGDEGKGLMTDYFSNDNTVVVRYNGGAQAGHTVVTPDGSRHVFHHFGSGTFRGARTFLSRFFITSPIFYAQEMKILRDFGLNPRPYIEPDCLVTTPYDIMLNQALENSRGKNRHGSCGMGIHETILRNGNPQFTITYQDLTEKRWLRNRLKAIRTTYARRRKTELGISQGLELLEDDAILHRFMDDVGFMLETSVKRKWGPLVLDKNQNAVFEGAQGLMLDMDHPNFPYVTHSRTGLANVATLVKEANLKELQACYVARTYVTRHGEGPLSHERTLALPYTKIKDDTNVPNPHQGTLRFGLMDVDVLVDEIKKDLAMAGGVQVTPIFALTCADQVDDRVRFIHGGRSKERLPMEFARSVAALIGATDSLVSFGPTRNTIERGNL
jgi:adenylosuccinate synthase